eukprot:6739149-Pyramimonas_sp.AAC.1
MARAFLSFLRPLEETEDHADKLKEVDGAASLIIQMGARDLDGATNAGHFARRKARGGPASQARFSTALTPRPARRSKKKGRADVPTQACLKNISLDNNCGRPG